MNFFKRSISDPIRGLTLDRLSAQIDAYQNGYLAEFALTAEAMENRDDMLKNVITKRKKRSPATAGKSCSKIAPTKPDSSATPSTFSTEISPARTRCDPTNAAASNSSSIR